MEVRQLIHYGRGMMTGEKNDRGGVYSRTHPQQAIHDPRLQNEQQRPLDAGAMIPRVADVRFHVLAVVPEDGVRSARWKSNMQEALNECKCD